MNKEIVNLQDWIDQLQKEIYEQKYDTKKSHIENMSKIQLYFNLISYKIELELKKTLDENNL